MDAIGIFLKTYVCLLSFFLKEMPIKAFIHIHETIQSLAQLGHLQNLSSKGQAPM